MNSGFLIQLLFYYLLLNVILYFVADFAIYPVPASSYQNHQLPNQFTLTTSDDKEISAIYLKNPKADYTILFSHGNGEDLGLLLPFLEALRAQGFAVFAYDYHGYGTSLGRPTEKNTYRDIQASYDYLIQHLKIAPEKIILFGRSIGTGPTVELASKQKVAGVILESPMLTAFRVVTVLPLFLVDKYQNNKKIQQVSSPILFIHGKSDKVIPFWHGQKLFDLVTMPKKYFYAVEGADHNDVALVGGQTYWDAIVNFANTLEHN